MKLKQFESRLKPETKLADDFLDLRTIDANVIIQKLEDDIQIREMPLIERLKKGKTAHL